MTKQEIIKMIEKYEYELKDLEETLEEIFELCQFKWEMLENRDDESAEMIDSTFEEFQRCLRLDAFCRMKMEEREKGISELKLAVVMGQFD